MIKYRLTEYRGDQLTLGYKGEHCAFVWRAYKERSFEARKSYNELKADLIKNGMKHPLITYEGHVLIGMRRFEIIVALHGVQSWFECYDITEDVSQWGRDDINRLEEFKQIMYEVKS